MGKGKSKGKLFFSLVGFAFGALNPAVFGAKSWILNGLYGASLTSQLWSLTHQQKLSSNYSSQFSEQSNQISNDAMIPVIYGRRKFGGYQTWYKLSDDKKNITKDIILCEGDIDGVSDFRVNDLELSSLPGCSLDSYMGLPSQKPPDNYKDTGSYKHCAYMRARLKISEKLPGGNPTVTTIVRGKKVLDTRTDTYVWSDNPALCVRDYLLSRRYGLAKYIPDIADYIDEESFKEVADYCDEIVEYKDEKGEVLRDKRYTLNIILLEKKNAIEHLADMFACFGGYLVISEDKLSLRVEKPTVVSYSFNENNIIRDSVKFNQISTVDSPNQYKVGFIDPNNEWTETKVLIEDTLDQKEHRRVVPKEVTLKGCTSQTQAIRMGQLMLNNTKFNSLIISFSTGTYAMGLEAGDVISVTYKNLINNMPFRITEISEQNGTWNIKGRQYNSGIYNQNYYDQIDVKSYTQIPNPLSKEVPDVINVDVKEYFRNLGNGQWINEAKITWNSDDIFYKHAEVYMLSDNPTIDDIEVSWEDLGGTLESLDSSSNSWKFIGTSDGSITVSNLVKGLTYTFKIVAVNTKDRKVNFSNAPTVNFYCRGKTLTPSTPRGLTVSITDVCSWNWSMGDTDVDFWELRTDEKVGDTTGLLTSTAVNKAIVTPPSRKGTVYLFAHNTGGYYSDPCVLTYNHPAPVAPKVVDITQIFQGYVVTTEALPVFCQGINVHADDGVGDKVFFSPNNSYTYKTTSGIYDVRVAFVDLFGEGHLSKVQLIIVEPTIDPELLAAESISLEKMNGHVAAMLAKAQVSIDTATFEKAIAERVSYVNFNSTVNTLVQADNANASAIQQTSTDITNTVAKLNSAPDVTGQFMAISKLMQAANSITSTIADMQKADTSLQSQITQAANSVTSIVTELGKPPEKSSYSSISQLLTAINLRVTSTDFNSAMQPNKLITQINLAPGTITLDGKLTHITGKTLIDNDVIATGMIKAGAITAEKIAAGAITANTLGVTELSAITAKIGTLRTATTGARTEIKDNLILVYDQNNMLRVKMGVW